MNTLRLGGFPERPDIREVAPHHRFVTPSMAEQGVEEYFDVTKGQRFLFLPSPHNEETAEYDKVREALGTRADQIMLREYSDPADPRIILEVPEGASRVSAFIPSIVRHAEDYGPIFQNIGRIIGRLSLHNLGVPLGTNGRNVLDYFGYEQDTPNVFGGSVLLIPPYNLVPGAGLEQFSSNVSAQLRRSGYLDSQGAGRLIGQIQRGYHEIAKQ